MCVRWHWQALLVTASSAAGGPGGLGLAGFDSDRTLSRTTSTSLALAVGGLTGSLRGSLTASGRLPGQMAARARASHGASVELRVSSEPATGSAACK